MNKHGICEKPSAYPLYGVLTCYLLNSVLQAHGSSTEAIWIIFPITCLLGEYQHDILEAPSSQAYPGCQWFSRGTISWLDGRRPIVGRVSNWVTIEAWPWPEITQEKPLAPRITAAVWELKRVDCIVSWQRVPWWGGDFVMLMWGIIPDSQTFHPQSRQQWEWQGKPRQESADWRVRSSSWHCTTLQGRL